MYTYKFQRLAEIFACLPDEIQADVFNAASDVIMTYAQSIDNKQLASAVVSAAKAEPEPGKELPKILKNSDGPLIF